LPAAATNLLDLEACLMTKVKYLVVILMVCLASACTNTGPGQSAKTLPDNRENRTMLAKRYLEVMTPKEMLQGLANRIAPHLPEKERQPFIEVMNSPGIEQASHRILLDSLVKNFSAGELRAMVTFYESPEGQSAYRKYGLYMGEIMPQIQKEVKKTLETAQKQPGPGEPPKTHAPPGEPGKKEPQKPKSQK
jgi:hypothetical protein